jgi:hypothetical protein
MNGPGDFQVDLDFAPLLLAQGSTLRAGSLLQVPFSNSNRIAPLRSSSFVNVDLSTLSHPRWYLGKPRTAGFAQSLDMADHPHDWGAAFCIWQGFVETKPGTSPTCISRSSTSLAGPPLSTLRAHECAVCRGKASLPCGASMALIPPRLRLDDDARPSHYYHHPDRVGDSHLSSSFSSCRKSSLCFHSFVAYSLVTTRSF